MKKLLMIFVLVFALVFISGCCKTVEVPYTGVEDYTVQVPYEEQESYTTELEYEVVDSKATGSSSGFLNYVTKGTVKIRNTDIETGEFIVEQTFDTLNDDPVTYKTKKRITAGETVEFIETYDSELGEDVKLTYNVIPSSITKFRTVTKYRTETRSREVEKVRTEKRGLFCSE